MSESVYKVVESCGKGKIAVAVRDIRPGEFVVSENEPIMHLSNEFISKQPHILGLTNELTVLRKYAMDLSPQQKKKLLSLFGPTDTKSASIMRPFVLHMIDDGYIPDADVERYLKVLQVFRFNAFELGVHGHGVFAEITRFSHSCAPNCSFSFRGTAVHCYARTFIKTGEELTITYKGKRDLQPTHERRYMYLNSMEFTCHCPRCDAPGDDMRQFDCVDPDCGGVMMVCQPINKKPIPCDIYNYEGVEYVEPHLLPCTVCHRAAPADYQAKMFALEDKMYEQGPQLAQKLFECVTNPTNTEVASTPVPRRHGAALPFLQTAPKLKIILMDSNPDASARVLIETRQAAQEYVTFLFKLLPVPSDNLSEEMNNVVLHYCKSDTLSIFLPKQQRLVCAQALRMYLLLYGRDRREKVLDETMLKCHEQLLSARSTDLCAFCEESPLRAALTLSRCGRCKQVAYCSVGCQKAHWKVHKKECKAVGK